MKTYEQLMTHYWGVIVPMAEAAGINPWECVKYKTYLNHFTRHPEFALFEPSTITFALTVLEKRPVFVGDRLYGKNLPITVLANEHFNLGDYTWTPPTPKVTPKKRTFMLNGKELNSPVNKGKGDYLTRVAGNEFYFTNYDDRNALDNILYELLTIARDKEE